MALPTTKAAIKLQALKDRYKDQNKVFHPEPHLSPSPFSANRSPIVVENNLADEVVF